MRHVMLGLVIVIRFVGHAGTDHVEGDTVEMPRVRSDVGGEVFQAAGRPVQHDKRRFRRIAGLNKPRLQLTGVDPGLAERCVKEFGPDASVGLLHVVALSADPVLKGLRELVGLD